VIEDHIKKLCGLCELCAKQISNQTKKTPRALNETMYTELQITTNFSFLRGGSDPEEMIKQALALSYKK
jgi:hypothetical protein